MSFFHFLVAMAAFAALGVAAHVLRAVVNPYPDRLSDRPWMDVAVSDGYSVEDHLLQVEYDDFGFYRLDSRRNLVITVVLTMLGGFVLLAFDAATAHAASSLIAASLDWLGELASRRLAEIAAELGAG